MLTRRRTRAIQGEDEQPYHLDVKRKPKAVGIENNDLEQSKPWTNLPPLVLEKIFRFAAGEKYKIDKIELNYNIRYSIQEDHYFQHLKKYTKVCTAWRDFILGSKYLTNGCKHYELSLGETCDPEAELDFVQSGFLGIVEELSFVEDCYSRSKMDTMGFVRDHVKDKTTALTTILMDINDFTNIEALPEILASAPRASTFTIRFEHSELDVQIMAERYWKVLLAVFYCNNNDKTVLIRDTCYHVSHAQRNVADWTFTRNEYKRYRNVQNPGKIKELEFQEFCPLNYSDMFYKAPIFDQVAIDHVTVPIVDFDATQFTNFSFKCARLVVDYEYWDTMLPSGPWTYFANCEKLEIYFPCINRKDKKITHHNVLKLLKHSNLHVVLGCPIRVSDANPVQPGTSTYKWYGQQYWTLFDVENFANQIAVLSIKTLTYTFEDFRSSNYKSPTITFNCDENFPLAFMEFLQTQRIYCGYKQSMLGEEEGFLTLESAKESFPNSF